MDVEASKSNNLREPNESRAKGNPIDHGIRKYSIVSFYLPCIVKADSAAALNSRWSKISPMSKKLVAYTAILPFFDTTATSDRSLT